MPRRSSSRRISGPGSVGNCSRKWVARPCRGRILVGRAPGAPAFRWATGCAHPYENSRKAATGTHLRNFISYSLKFISARLAVIGGRNAKTLPVGEIFLPLAPLPEGRLG